MDMPFFVCLFFCELGKICFAHKYILKTTQLNTNNMYNPYGMHHVADNWRNSKFNLICLFILSLELEVGFLL